MTIFAIVLGIINLIVGAAKLAGAKPIAEQFDEFGISSAGMRAVGALEVAAAVGLQVDRLEILAPAGMIAMMIGALYHHRHVGHPLQSLAPAAVVLLSSLVFVVLVV